MGMDRMWGLVGKEGSGWGKGATFRARRGQVGMGELEVPVAHSDRMSRKGLNVSIGDLGRFGLKTEVFGM